MTKKTPEIKQGVNKGRRVYWVTYPCCGQPNGREHVAKAEASRDKREHKCDG